jgi:ribonuclease HII
MQLFIAGIDEAGRGPLAGPVVAAAVILDPARRVRGLRDSKVMTPEQRESVAADIRSRAIAWAFAASDVGEIDAMNILRATLLAMRRAVEALSVQPIEALIDGDHCPQLACPAYAIIKGDRDVPAISAASIIAKTARDAMLTALDREYPMYGFARHKGYGTPEHLAALDLHGPCPHHRKTFAPVLQASFPFW